MKKCSKCSVSLREERREGREEGRGGKGMGERGKRAQGSERDGRLGDAAGENSLMMVGAEDILETMMSNVCYEAICIHMI